MESFFSSEPSIIPPTGETKFIPFDFIYPNPYQAREDFDLEELEALASTIREHGVMNRPQVRPHPAKPERFQLVQGERRFRAMKLVFGENDGAEFFVVQKTDLQMQDMVLLENKSRVDLNPIEKAKGYKRYITEFNLPQNEIASRAGVSEPVVSNALRLLELPPATLASLTDGTLTEAHGKILCSLLPNADAIFALTHDCVVNEWSTRVLGHHVKEARKAIEAAAEKAAAEAQPPLIVEDDDEEAPKVEPVPFTGVLDFYQTRALKTIGFESHITLLALAIEMEMNPATASVFVIQLEGFGLVQGEKIGDLVRLNLTETGKALFVSLVNPSSAPETEPDAEDDALEENAQEWPGPPRVVYVSRDRLEKGDIFRSDSMESIALSQDRKIKTPFDYEGSLMISVGPGFGVGPNVHRCFFLIPEDDYEDDIHDYPGEPGPRFYHGMRVSHKGEPYVMYGPPVFFAPIVEVAEDEPPAPTPQPKPTDGPAPQTALISKLNADWLWEIDMTADKAIENYRLIHQLCVRLGTTPEKLIVKMGADLASMNQNPDDEIQADDEDEEFAP